MLSTSSGALTSDYDLAALDLDGVVYVGPDAVPHAVESLRAAQAAGLRLAYVTNNAARTPETVADHLRDLGAPAENGDVVSSAQAASTLLADRLEAGSKVFVIGGDGLHRALEERGLVPVTELEDSPVAVVQGYGPDMPWKRVVLGAVLVRQGLPWVVSNTDSTIPTAAGIGPGNGTLVDLVARFAERDPVVAGKPAAPLFHETLERVGGRRPLMVGDRLDTDIEGAVDVGWDSLLVLTGVTGLEELVRARPGERPTYLAGDLRGLLAEHRAPEVSGDTVTLGGWRAEVASALEVTGSGSGDDWWRVVAVAAWSRLDATGEPVEVGGLTPPAPEPAE